MIRKDSQSKKKSREIDSVEDSLESSPLLNPRVKKSIIGIFLIVFALLVILSVFGGAGKVGSFLYTNVFDFLIGYGVIIIPVISIIYASHLFRDVSNPWTPMEYLGAGLLGLSSLGLVHVISPELQGGGIIGKWIGTAVISLFDIYAGVLVLAAIILVSLLILLEQDLRIPSYLKKLFSREKYVNDVEIGESIFLDDIPDEELLDNKDNLLEDPVEVLPASLFKTTDEQSSKKKNIGKDEEDIVMTDTALLSETYEYPPTSLLGKSSGKPSVGDIRANANLIKRTLLNFGIDVEMDEVSIGPTVTRYALKPAEGVKLSRIVALKSDLALALAAHPIRIEAPIPGKALVGIEIPNRTMASVGLGSLLDEDVFQSNPNRLSVALGKTVTGKSFFANLAKMPHLLIAGTTGSGKSVTVHNLILSLLYRNGPEDLRLIMVDPKRVELTLYNDIPHLLTPVIKEPKKAVLALKWAAKEMERRYDILEHHTCRDIQSYHKNILEPYLAKTSSKKEPDATDAPERMPYIVVFIDELADIMQAYPRELESGIVRLAQMSRAVGIHLVLSTQRPSVNVITGLIKANIPSRLALQVASQIDSRTILDAPGAESLLGKGDMLFQGEGMSKPERMQCANVSEDQVKSVVSFIKKHSNEIPDEITLGEVLDDDRSIVSANLEDEDEDELYEDARICVTEAGKASTSYIQRKLKVGYSRAARLMDILEDRGVIGPADGSKPREILDRKPHPEDL